MIKDDGIVRLVQFPLFEHRISPTVAVDTYHGRIGTGGFEGSTLLPALNGKSGEKGEQQ